MANTRRENKARERSDFRCSFQICSMPFLGGFAMDVHKLPKKQHRKIGFVHSVEKTLFSIYLEGDHKTIFYYSFLLSFFSMDFGKIMYMHIFPNSQNAQIPKFGNLGKCAYTLFLPKSILKNHHKKA